MTRPFFRWASGGQLVSRALIDGDRAYCLSEDGSIVALDQGGKILFRSELGIKPGDQAFSGRDGCVFVARGDRVLRLSRAGGLASYYPRLANGGSASGRIWLVEGGDGRVFILDGDLACFSAAGAIKWRLALPKGSSPRGLALLGDGSLACAMSDQPIWKVSAFGGILSQIAAPADTQAIVSGPGGLAALGSAGELWLYETGGAVLARLSGYSAVSPAYESNRVSWYALSGPHALLALDSGGLIVWRRELGFSAAGLLSYPGRVYALGADRVEALNREGLSLKEIALEHSRGLFSVSPSGILYSAGSDWVLYAYRFDQERLADHGPAWLPSIPPYGLGEDGGGRLSRELAEYGYLDRDWIDETLNDARSSLDGAGLLATGQQGGEAAITPILRELAQWGLGSVGGGGGTSGPSLEQRARAIGLLGRLGSIESRGALLGILSGEGEGYLRQAACQALGEIAWDGDGVVIATLARLYGTNYRPLDEAELMAACEAIGSISRFEGLPRGMEGLRALIRIGQLPYSSRVKAKAEAAIRSLAAFAIQR